MEDDPYAFHESDGDSTSAPANTTTDSVTSSEYARMARRIERELEENEEGEPGAVRGVAADSDEGIDVNTSEDAAEYPEGLLVWAKLKGYSYWPSIVTVDPVEAKTCTAGKKRQVHVHFIGYENQRAWIRETSLMAFNGKADYMRRANECKKGRKKDFFPSSSLRKPFEDAVKEAESVVGLAFKERLKKLCFVYVLVSSPKVEVKTAAEKKFLSPTSASSPTRAEVLPLPKRKGVPGKRRGASSHAKAGAGKRRKTSSKNRVAAEETSGGSNGSGMPCVRQAKKRRWRKPQGGGSRKATATTATTKVKSSDPHPPAAAAEEGSEKSESKARESPPVVRISTPEQSCEIRDLADEDDEFLSEPESESGGASGGASGGPAPRLGSLVWGRMAGFPYWPCFVTKNPEGEHRRRNAKGTLHHVQFFNWNDESGWVSSAMPWCTLEEFRAQADKVPKSSPQYKSWHPQGRAMAKKWAEAYEEAQSTAHMSRRERHDRLVVFYKDEVAASSFRERFLDAATRKGGSVGDNAKQQATDRGGSAGNEVAHGDAQATSAGGKRQGGAVRKKRRRLRGPRCVRRRVALDSVLSPEDLPPGWTMRRSGKGKREFKSPEGAIFFSLREVVGRLFQQNVDVSSGARRRRSFSGSGLERDSGEKGWFISSLDNCRFRKEEAELSAGILGGQVSYLRDRALPSQWVVKKEEDRLLYIAPNRKEEPFRSKWEAAEYLEPKGHPANELEVLLGKCVVRCRERRERITQRRLQREREREREAGGGANDTSEEDEEDANASQYLSIDLNSVTAQDILGHPVMGKTVIPTLVEMVKLPGIFLEHPSVRVKEENNEMTITDVDTAEFIAKKIIYD